MIATHPAAVETQRVESRPFASYVMPAFNEEARLPASLDRVIAFLAQQRFAAEIVVADDGSRDRTPRIVRAREDAGLPSNVTLRLVQHEHNEGKGAAIRTGCLAARGEYVFFMDADLATPPEDSLRLLACLEEGHPVVAGSRIQPDGSDMRESQPTQRRTAGRIFTTMRKAIGVLRDIEDTQCPMKGFRHDAARAVFERQRLEGWIFDAEVLHIARKLGYPIVSVPVTWQHVEGSRLRMRPKQAWEVLRDLVKLRFLYGNVAAPPAVPTPTDS
ncbi:MAG: dolichyl-phosphate beta-glucosyltransferase [Dehalococcoidia bacterium]